MTSNVGLHSMLVTLHRGLHLVLSKTKRIGDTRYHVTCIHVIWVKNDARGDMLYQCVTPNGNSHYLDKTAKF